MGKEAMLVFINRKSRRGDDPGLAAVLNILRQGGMEIIESYSESRTSLERDLKRHYRRLKAVVIGGGDGTLHFAADILVRTALPVGVLPLGTANDMARSLGIPANLEQAAHIIVEGKLQPVNVGIVNGKYFFNAANIGLGVKVTLQLSETVKKKFGVISYAKSLFDAFGNQKPFWVRVEYDRNRLLRLKSMQVAVGNGRYYGGGVAISGDANIWKDELVLYSLKPRAFWRTLVLGPLFKFGRIEGIEGIALVRSKTFNIETSRPMSISADGEIVSETPARFSFLSKAVKVYAPEG